MIRRLPAFLLLLVALFAAAPRSFGQSVLQVTLSANGGTFGVASGGGVALAANGIGQPISATVQVRYTGSSVATISSISLTNTTEMSLQLPPTLPVTLNPGTTTTFTVQYIPVSGNQVIAEIPIVYSETGQSANTFLLTVTGTSPRVSFNYSFTNGNLTTLNSGDTIPFPAANVGTSVAAVINVLNSGSAAGSLSSVTLSGAGFQLSSSPAPTLLQAGQQVSIDIAFAPQSTGGNQGLLSLVFGGNTATFQLSGTGTAASLSASYALADGNVHPLSTGTTIAFPSIDINVTTTATITIANQGTGAGSVTAINISGAGFQINGLPALPVTIPAGQSLRFGIVFAPTQTGAYTGTFFITMSGVSISGALAGSTAPSNISLAYIDPNTNNVVPLANNSTLQFPSTLVGAVTSVVLVATNNGTGTGSIGAISLSGASSSTFQLLNLPALPVSIGPAQQARFGVRFSPLQQQSYGGVLLVAINGQTLTVNLAAQGSGPQYTYTVTAGTATSTVIAGGTIAIANTTVGQNTSVTILIANAGTGNGQINGIGVTGQGLSLSNLPPFPLTLIPNGSQQFTLNYAPTQPGALAGQLTIGADTFTVTSTAIGSLLLYSYTNSAGATTVAAGGAVIFAPIAVGSSESLVFSIQNTGTSAATISSISLAAPSTVFSLQQLPGLPFNLNPNATTTFTVGFVPNNLGALTASLAVNGADFVLSGTGTQPAALPAYQFHGASGTLQPAQQPTVGLTLASSYPLALTGSLTLTFASAVFTDDPSIEFANGSRTVNFTIPANSTQVVFSGNSTSVPLQTGTTAGTITITPSFAIQGGFNVTPASPSVLSLTVPRVVPQLLSGSVTSETLTSFTLLLGGYSTTRILNQFNIQITPKQGTTFSTNSLTIDVSSTSAAWFQGTASSGFGGSFLVAIPFTLQNGSTTTDLVHLLQSLSITATNDAGVSSAISVPIP